MFIMKYRNVQQQFVYFIVVVCRNTLKSFVSQCLDFFYKKPVKFCWGSMFLFFEAFQPHNGLILFLFFIKTSFPLKAKNTPNEIAIVYC